MPLRLGPTPSLADRRLGPCLHPPLQGSGSEAVLVALLAAKARALRGRPAEDVVKLVCYGTDQVCSCLPWGTCYAWRWLVCCCVPERKLCLDCMPSTPLSPVHATCIHASANHLPQPALQTHSCFKKACMIAGILHVHTLPTLREDAYAMRARCACCSRCTALLRCAVNAGAAAPRTPGGW